MKIIKDFFQLFYPKLCVACENQLISGEKILCTFCKHDLPLVSYEEHQKNKIAELFYGRIPIEKATALFFYKKKTKTIIHQLKYKGNEAVGSFIGDWFGEKLKENHQFEKVDYIIPVPLHKKKLKKRGYNQVTKFGEKLSEILNIPFAENVLIRNKATVSQAQLKGDSRYENIQNKFLINDTSFFENKHVLLIDDVITTGATLESCCKELLKTKGIKISIAAMAVAEQQ